MDPNKIRKIESELLEPARAAKSSPKFSLPALSQAVGNLHRNQQAIKWRDKFKVSSVLVTEPMGERAKGRLASSDSPSLNKLPTWP